MTNKNKIIDLVVNDKYYLDYCKKVCNGKDIHKDLFQYVMLYILELPEKKLLEINTGNLKGYITRIIYLNAYFKTAPFYKEYHCPLVGSDNYLVNDIVDETDNDLDAWRNNLIEKVPLILELEKRQCENEGNYAWNVELFKIWQKEGSCRKVAKKTKIPYPTVRYHVSALIKKINENINHNY